MSFRTKFLNEMGALKYKDNKIVKIKNDIKLYINPNETLKEPPHLHIRKGGKNGVGCRIDLQTFDLLDTNGTKDTIPNEIGKDVVDKVCLWVLINRDLLMNVWENRMDSKAFSKDFSKLKEGYNNQLIKYFIPIRSAYLLDNKTLRVKFNCSLEKDFDLSSLYKHEIFRDLQKEEVVKTFDVYGDGIVWNDDIEIDSNTLWYCGKLVE